MPGQDRTGPQGMGSGTGRGMGLCGGAPAGGPAFIGRGARFFRGGGRGGCGFGAGFYPVSGENREEILRAQQAHLKNRLDFIQKELDNGSKADVPQE